MDGCQSAVIVVRLFSWSPAYFFANQSNISYKTAFGLCIQICLYNWHNATGLV
jgi:hypothetical protein